MKMCYWNKFESFSKNVFPVYHTNTFVDFKAVVIRTGG